MCAAVQIVSRMKDETCAESENVTFEVEVSHPGIDAFWTFKGQPLKAGSKFKMESKSTLHTLTVLNATKDEEGEFTFAAGEKTCAALLTVSGMTDALALLGCAGAGFGRPFARPHVAKVGVLELTLISCHQEALSRSLSGTWW